MDISVASTFLLISKYSAVNLHVHDFWYTYVLIFVEYVLMIEIAGS